jgi:hypothetical protein
MPGGCIFDVAGSALFPSDDDLDFLLAYLNSSFARALAGAINPTVNFQVGDIKRLPLVPLAGNERARLSELGQECFRLKRSLHALNVTSLDFVAPAELSGIAPGADLDRFLRVHRSSTASIRKALACLEAEVDSLVLEGFARALKLPEPDARSVADWARHGAAGKASPADEPPDRLLCDLITVIVRERIGVLSGAGDCPSSCTAPAADMSAPLLLPLDDDRVAARCLGLSDDQSAWLGALAGEPLNAYLEERFAGEHARRFRGVPALAVARAGAADLLVVPSAYARALVRGRKNGRWSVTDRLWAEAGISDCGRLAAAKAAADDIMDSAAGSLKSTPGWTGADLKALINSPGAPARSRSSPSCSPV